MKLFGTNGIRGVFSKDFTLDLVHDITQSIASYFKNGVILVGYDGRYSSPLIAKIVCSTLNYSGLDCKLAGLIPTPCLQLAVKKLGYDGGIMVTASHNPPKYNGVKVMSSDGIEISEVDQLIIEHIYTNKKWIKDIFSWGKTKNENRATRVYIDSIKSHIDISKIRSQKFVVVIDLGNGVQSLTAPQICKELCCEVITINENIDGSFPGRGSEPTVHNLQVLSDTVNKFNADLGVAFDGDGDRCIFCDEKGKVLDGNDSALIISNFILKEHPNSTIVTCLNSCSSIDEITITTKSKVIRTKVGSVNVSRKMKSINAIIGFEENGGFMFGKHIEVRDGAMTMALMLNLLSISHKTLSQEFDMIPHAFTIKTKLRCSNESANEIITKLKSKCSNFDDSDGLKIIFDSKNWIMIRKSGTEQLIRIYAEGNNKKKLDTIVFRYVNKINSLRQHF